ncbi:hypothetical protein BKA65DRAFT_491856 [Rhexocercosporidium sp. MPI-PUGE-AT-0058]|nr:hypothetical protein BKA65DRAFT_491856 [Rhexocercosporidium sp. MPI-PUGE-AT-0058]
MEGLAALSVAASVAQFVQFGVSLVSKTSEIYKSTRGTTVQYAELETATKRLVSLNKQLEGPQRVTKDRAGHVSQALEDIRIDCVGASTDLLARLESLKINEDHKHRHWKSFRQALKAVCSRGEIEAMAKKLRTHQKELDGHILMSLSERFNDLTILHDENFASLDTNLQKSVRSLLDTLIDIHKKMEQVLEVQQATVDRAQQNLQSETRRAEKIAAKEAAEKARMLDERANDCRLSSLRFSTMRSRQEEICGAHQKTFSWIYEPPLEHSRPWSSFPKWLREDSDMYWINGKAGSGKSTLLRYIYDNPQTSELLKIWAGYEELGMAGFFFWNSGDIEQRSQSGVFRSLLFQILRKRRDLIRYSFAAPWAEYRASIQLSEEELNGSNGRVYEWKWSIATLQQAFTQLASLANPRFKLCFFIDGLDECEGDQEGLSEYFLEISKLSNVKICLSSRPWLVFEETFSDCPGLRLQDLTKHDMRVYVQDKLAANRKMLELSKSDPQAARKFIKTAEGKANGVFLWVKLVTKSLLDGLRNQDNIDDLQRRLESIPSDLNALYCLMLGRIDDIYMEQASRIFQIYDRASDLDLRMSALELELAVSANVEDSISNERRPMTSEDINSRSEKMTTHLKSRCEGLLEVHDLLDRQWDAFDGDNDPGLSSDRRIENDEDSLVNHTERSRTKVDMKVSYLHRTVKDFLKTQYVREKFRHSSMSEFDPNLALLVSYVINLKRSVCSFYYDVQGISWDVRLWGTVRDALTFARGVTDSSRDLLLHQLFNLGQQWWQYKSLSTEVKLLNPRPYRQAAEWHERFVSLAVYFGFTSFVDEQLRHPTLQDISGPLLAIALGIETPKIPTKLPKMMNSSSFTLVSILLRYGADPDERTPNSCTIWEMYLRLVHSGMHSRDRPDVLREQALMMKVMLENGADLFVKCASHTAPSISALEGSSRQEHSVADVIVDMFAGHLPEETMMLYELLQKKRFEAKAADKKLGYHRRDMLGLPDLNGIGVTTSILRQKRAAAEEPELFQPPDCKRAMIGRDSVYQSWSGMANVQASARSP